MILKVPFSVALYYLFCDKIKCPYLCMSLVGLFSLAHWYFNGDYVKISCTLTLVLTPPTQEYGVSFHFLMFPIPSLFHCTSLLSP